MGSSDSNFFSFALEVLLLLYSLTLLLRILLQWVHANYYNPVCQVIIKVTDPLLRPLKTIFPQLGPIDTAAMLLYLGLVTAAVVLWDPRATDVPSILAHSLFRVVLSVLQLYTVLLFLGAILSWADQGIRHPIIPLIHQLNEPVLKPFRRFIPPIGGLDLSPLFAIVAIQLLLRLVGL